MRETMFLLILHVDYEGSTIADSFWEMPRALEAVHAPDGPMSGDRMEDGVSILALNGRGPGVTIARWRREWTTEWIEGEGPPDVNGEPPEDIHTDRHVWRRTL